MYNYNFNFNIDDEISNFKKFLSSNEDSDMHTYIERLLAHNLHCITPPFTKKLDYKDYFNFIEGLSYYCPSLSLSFSMHLYTTWGLDYLLTSEQKKYFFPKIIEERALFSSLNEPGLYFIHPKNINLSEYPIIAQKIDNHSYILNGTKRFVSLEPFVRYLPVYAKLEGYTGPSHGIGLFIVDKNKIGVSVKQSWDTIAMADTYSNDITFNNVCLNQRELILDGTTSINSTNILGYLFRFFISGVYYGIAHRALDYITELAQRKKVPHTNQLLGKFPGVQFSIAEMIITLETMYSQIMHFCNLMNNIDENSKAIEQTSLVTKEYITTSSRKIIDAATRVHGIQSLFSSDLLSKLYRDVKAGEFHPPQRDITYELLSKRHLGLITLKNRWC
ncbi:TPA: acyl-CoA/acyl-ACP dehydrogenase [Bacillus cereus]|nr:acyl-CoA/acyl-ACP dehydrogenase [Bacillus cereus]